MNWVMIVLLAFCVGMLLLAVDGLEKDLESLRQAIEAMEAGR